MQECSKGMQSRHSTLHAVPQSLLVKRNDIMLTLDAISHNSSDGTAV